MDQDKTVLMEGVRILFRNFAGKEGPMNREGDRNFCVLLDEEVAEAMHADGWNVKPLRAREEGDPDQPYLPVSVNFKNRPPKIWLVSSRGRTLLSEDVVEILDYADILSVDLLVNPYNWTVNGKSGVKAYLKTAFIVINEDELELKYADLNELPTRSGKVDDDPPWNP